ncbi:hypothetical protein BKA62DRAFT_819875 [Auriculariales sp. MPI-PUGE-AT-0066]|nr:hypothetical protein BKA62DRAFT_819875 [Auriculariales sp. MPI-PUGE-AT-0066]
MFPVPGSRRKSFLSNDMCTVRAAPPSGLYPAHRDSSALPMLFFSPVTVMRTDPIVSPGVISNHVHSILGGFLTMNCDNPAVALALHVKVKQITSTIYYLQRPNHPGEGVRAFPKGFRMLTGDMTLRSFDVNEPSQRAVTFNCLDYGNTTGAAGEGHGFPKRNCPSGLRTQPLDSSNHRGHVAYPDGIDNGQCPDSHPVRLVSIFYEFVYDTAAFEFWDGGSADIGQPFVLATGDPTVVGTKANGSFKTSCNELWISARRTRALLRNALFSTATFVLTKHRLYVPRSVPRLLSNNTPPGLENLPGCNPIQAGPTNAVVQSSCGNHPPSGQDFVPRSSVSFVADTNVAGWSKLGCAKEPAGKRILSDLWGGENATASPMSVDRCVQHCSDAGWRYAGLENGNECWCGSSLGARASDVIGSYVCDTPCAEDSFANGGTLPLNCGGPNRLALYKNSGQPPPTLGKPRCRVRKKMSSLEALAIGQQRVLAMHTSSGSKT